MLDPKSKKYYWFGERRGSPRGIGCYSSSDLYNWKREGVAMTAEAAGLTGMVFERPKVLYSPTAGKYVLWYHHDDAKYAMAQLGVATSDNINGPYVMVAHSRPNGHESRDLSLFVDDDGKAYIFYSADGNTTIRVVALSDDYLSLTTLDADTRAHCEGEGVFRKNGVYYLLSSACTGWTPNRTAYAMATDIMGPYRGKGDPSVGDTAKTTFNSQPSFIYTVPGYQDGYLYMGDRWNGSGSVKSQYVFLPIAVTKSGAMELRCYGSWDLSRFTPGTASLVRAGEGESQTRGGRSPPVTSRLPFLPGFDSAIDDPEQGMRLGKIYASDRAMDPAARGLASVRAFRRSPSRGRIFLP